MTYEQVLIYKKAAKKSEELEKLTKSKSKKLFKALAKLERTNPKTRSNRRLTGKLHSLILGPITSTLATGGTSALLGGLIGGLSTKEPIGALIGAAIGGNLGVGLSAGANSVAYLIGLLRRVRTNKEQEKYESSKGATVANYLLPGAATYNRAATEAANRDTLARLRLDKM